jgi:hypothetical protein
MPWEAAARMRVACFFLGLFNTITRYMDTEIGDNVEKWRKDYLHTGDRAQELNRRNFWRDVVKAALHELRPGSDNRSQMESWLNQGSDPYVSNSPIRKSAGSS